MEQKQQQIEPMTPEQIEAESAYAEKIYQELSNAGPEKLREIHESIKLRTKSKAASLTDPKSKLVI
jgi:uncharacterized membrane protein YqiK